jgi:CubicO group peptidase (beta-lactamase class C family)
MRPLFHRFLLALALVSVPLNLWAAEPKITAALQPLVDSGSLAGAVALVSSPDKVLSVETVGFSDVGGKVPMKADNIFWIASMSKPITAAGLMILVDEGKVKIEDPVEKYLPEFKYLMLAAYSDKDVTVLKRPARPITVRDILSHTSGLPFRSPLEEPTLDGLSLKEAAHSYALTPLKFEPGSKYDYSNAGINTAGRIIEVVSGMPYEDFMDKRLFQPLGMKDTTFWPNPDQVQRIAKSYKPNKEKTGLEETTVGQLKYPLSDRKRQPMPAGGLFSTADDVAIFCRMVLHGGTLDGKRYLSEAAVRQMTSTQTGDLLNQGKGENGYGLGWSTSKKAREDAVIPGTCGHGGAFATNMSIDPEKHLIFVYMVQHAGFPGDGGKGNGLFQKAALEAFGK